MEPCDSCFAPGFLSGLWVPVLASQECPLGGAQSLLSLAQGGKWLSARARLTPLSLGDLAWAHPVHILGLTGRETEARMGGAGLKPMGPPWPLQACVLSPESPSPACPQRPSSRSSSGKAQRWTVVPAQTKPGSSLLHGSFCRDVQGFLLQDPDPGTPRSLGQASTWAARPLLGGCGFPEGGWLVSRPRLFF